MTPSRAVMAEAALERTTRELAEAQAVQAGLVGALEKVTEIYLACLEGEFTDAVAMHDMSYHAQKAQSSITSVAKRIQEIMKAAEAQLEAHDFRGLGNGALSRAICAHERACRLTESLACEAIRAKGEGG